MRVYVVLYGERGFTCDIAAIYAIKAHAERHRKEIQAKITSSVDFVRVDIHDVKRG